MLATRRRCRPDGRVRLSLRSRQAARARRSYILFAPVVGKLEGALPVVRRLDIKDQAVQPLPQLLESSFAFEMLRTAYLAKQFVREASADGSVSRRAAQRLGAEPTCLVLGLERQPYGRGLALPQTFGGVQSRPGLPWIGLPRNPLPTKALVQTPDRPSGHLRRAFVATAGVLSDGACLPGSRRRLPHGHGQSLRASGGRAPGRLA